jgi:hypothetical protein
MEPTHAMTVHFTDGTKVSFGFPDQAKNAAARQIRLEEFLKSPYLLVLAEGILTALPVANIKAIQLPVDAAAMQGVPLPEHVIRDAIITRGEL